MKKLDIGTKMILVGGVILMIAIIAMICSIIIGIWDINPTGIEQFGLRIFGTALVVGVIGGVILAIGADMD